MKELSIFLTLLRNGWKEQKASNDDFSVYRLDFIGNYKVSVLASVSIYPKDLEFDGQYGVEWLEIAYYENKMPYGKNDLADMLDAFRLAEENLLAIGVPFTADYRFHKIKNGKRRNAYLRKKFNLDEREKRDYLETHKEQK